MHNAALPSEREAPFDIGAFVRLHDPDRHLAALFVPASARAALLALYAFNIELAHIAGHIREPQLGEIRLQWWRDAIGGHGGGHPVAEALAAARDAHNLPAPLLLGMIDARSFDVAREPMPGMDALAAYLRATAGAVFTLAGQIIAPPAAPPAAAPPAPNPLDSLAHHAAMAHGLTGLMRALPLHASRGRLYLPADILAAHGVSPRDVLSGHDTPGLRAALLALRNTAASELAAFSKAFASADRAMLPAFLPLALVAPHLRALAASRHRPLHKVARINPLRRVWLVWRAHLRGKI